MSASCDPAALVPDASTARPDEHFNALFTLSGPGWTGADSTYSVPLPDGRVLWLFSDTFLGTVNADRSRARTTPMVNNTLVVQDGATLTTLHGGTSDAPQAYLRPAQPDSWYWVYDATVEGDAVRVFLVRFTKNGSGPFGFRWVGAAVARLALPDLRVLDVRDLPVDGGVAWGAAVLEAGEFTYVYGSEDRGAEKFLHVARAPRGRVDDAWSYFTGSGWSSDAAASARVLPHVANEFSVTAVADGYVLVTMDTSEQFGADIVAYASCSPEGPWTNRTVVYHTPESRDEIFTYNAHAHPEFTENGDLLISYNQNSLSVAALYVNADFYRPRFIRVHVPALAR